MANVSGSCGDGGCRRGRAYLTVGSEESLQASALVERVVVIVDRAHASILTHWKAAEIARIHELIAAQARVQRFARAIVARAIRIACAAVLARIRVARIHCDRCRRGGCWCGDGADRAEVADGTLTLEAGAERVADAAVLARIGSAWIGRHCGGRRGRRCRYLTIAAEKADGTFALIGRAERKAEAAIEARIWQARVGSGGRGGRRGSS